MILESSPAENSIMVLLRFPYLSREQPAPVPQAGRAPGISGNGSVRILSGRIVDQSRAPAFEASASAVSDRQGSFGGPFGSGTSPADGAARSPYMSVPLPGNLNSTRADLQSIRVLSSRLMPRDGVGNIGSLIREHSEPAWTASRPSAWPLFRPAG